MADGVCPCPGDSSGVVPEGILIRAPVPPVRLNPDLPPKLEEIINKALEKDRDLRYQHASDFRADLKRLKRDTDTGRSVAQSSPPEDMPARVSDSPTNTPSHKSSGHRSVAQPAS